MQATVTNYIYDKVKELMAHVGLSDDTINRYDAFIISAIVIGSKLSKLNKSRKNNNVSAC